LSGHQSHVPGITYLPYNNPFESDLVSGKITNRKWLSYLGRGWSKWSSNHRDLCSSDWISSVQLLKWPLHGLVPYLI